MSMKHPIKGTDLARPFAPEHAAVIDALKEQLLIVFLKRLGGRIEVPVAEVDDTGHDMLALALNAETRVFTFEIRRKS